MSDRTGKAREIIELITTSDRMRSSSHFSQAVYRDEPIITTGRQMASYLPDRYREMRTISRWQEGTPHGRWLSDAELFYRQGTFMADYEDDCPYHGTFKAYFPTYSAMSDRQLRGYFTWRAAVRRGDIQETSLSFAYVYLYELINGIGITDPEIGFHQLKAFWESYRAFEPQLDRYARVWLRDYVVYHGLDASLIADSRSLTFDRALMNLVDACAPYDPAVLHLLADGAAIEPAPAPAGAVAPPATRPRRRAQKAPTIPLPPDGEWEDRLLAGIDALSTYRIRLARLYADVPADLRHVACAVYVRMLVYYRKHRKNGFIETLFGERASMPYTMFASAVFFEPQQHGPTDYALDPIHRYRCRDGVWTCTRVFGARDKSPQLGSIMRATDRKLREALGYPHRLKPKDMPKYLEQIIDQEVAAWLSWKEAHAPRRIDIDLAQLAGIRRAAATTREALLTDEERGEAAEMPPAGDACHKDPAAADAPLAKKPAASGTGAIELPFPEAARGSSATTPQEPSCGERPEDSLGAGDVSPASSQADLPAGGRLLDAAERDYLSALLEGTDPSAALARSGMTEDMLVDRINEKLFDIVYDTVIETGPDGARLIEDYEDDVKEVLA